MKKDLEKRLREARETGQPWHVVGSILQEWTATQLHGTNVWPVATKATDLSELMLRRYIAALDRLGEIETSHALPPASLLPPTFGPTELAIRLYGRDPVAGLKALHALKQRKMTLRDLRVELRKSEGHAYEGNRARERTVLVATCTEAISIQAKKLFGRGTVAQRRPSIQYFNTIGFEFRNSQGFIVGGADLYVGSPLYGSNPLSTIAQSVLMATYLPAYYIFLGPELRMSDAEHAVRVLEVLQGRSVGVVLLPEEGGAVVLRRPESSRKADRAKDYLSILEHLSIERGRTVTGAA
ncbi:hypothetical protein I6F36_24145 [Bradyrhizobium sp. BRP19]|uniref:hypothetical protein n=1 Tax=Bradyrhizobium sp. BRP19 TaxID=2793823 RepID=UPI001CD39B47|nr:hypothetical protein [Bradyrhizobium sp. BRP19]MCA1549927.1 hypothetical protein [Bradyrhizobium sp. BRP19]